MSYGYIYVHFGSHLPLLEGLTNVITDQLPTGATGACRQFFFCPHQQGDPSPNKLDWAINIQQTPPDVQTVAG